MESLRIRTSIVNHLVNSGLLVDHPFVLVDVGCSGGIHPAWRQFGENLVVLGFDPNLKECERLQAAESNPRARFVAGYVGLPKNHPFIVARAGERWGNNPWPRLSVASASDRWQAKHRTQGTKGLRSATSMDDQRFADSSTIVLPDFLKGEGIEYVDFIKIDTDGDDLAILVSLKDHLRALRILGLGVEINFFGSASETDNTLHNVDRLLKSERYELVDLTLRRYSTSALPSRFIGSAPGPTRRGRIVQGDALFVRDLANPLYAEEAREWTPARIVKLAALLDMFGLADCAAELVVLFRSLLEEHFDVDALLNDLVPRGPLSLKRASYASHVERFKADDRRFYKARPNWLRTMWRFARRVRHLTRPVSDG